MVIVLHATPHAPVPTLVREVVNRAWNQSGSATDNAVRRLGWAPGWPTVTIITGPAATAAGMTYAYAEALSEFENTNRIIDAKETREAQFALAERDHLVAQNANEWMFDKNLTGAYETYQTEVAAHAKTFAVNYAGKYEMFVTDASAAETTAAKAFAQHEKTLADDDAQAQATRSTAAESLEDFYHDAAQSHVDLVGTWDTAQQTAWSAFQKALAELELERVTLLGSKLATHASSSSAELAGWLTQLTAQGTTLADGVADGLDAQTGSLAGALTEYAGLVAEERRKYAAKLAEKTADHDEAISTRNRTYQDEQAEIERVWRVAVDAAQWTYERGEAAAEREYREDLADASLLDPIMEMSLAIAQAETDRLAAVALLEAPRMQDQGTAERDRTVALAQKLNAWVHDVGDIHVALANEAKTAADALATGLKGAADALTGDQAAAARQFAVAP